MDATLFIAIMAGAVAIFALFLAAKAGAKINEEREARARDIKHIDDLYGQRLNHANDWSRENGMKINLLLAELGYKVSPKAPTLLRTADWTRRKLDEEMIQANAEAMRVRCQLDMAELEAKNRRAKGKR